MHGIEPRKLKATGDPLFYLTDKHGDLVFFGPTMLFRLRYQRGLHNLIPPGLRDPLVVDYADALFGFVRSPQAFPEAERKNLRSGQKRIAYAGRIFVTEACLSNTTISEHDMFITEGSNDMLPLKILATPKPTTFQHYLVQPFSPREDLSHYDSPKADKSGIMRGAETILRGHKLYWHQHDRTQRDLRPEPFSPQANNRNGEPQLTSKVHTQANPLNSGVSFKFRVYFENLSKRELGALCWTLKPVGPAEKYCHSLGMGKPLGMGAVELQAELCLTDRNSRYTSLFGENGNWHVGDDKTKLQAEIWENAVTAFETDILNQVNPDKPCERLADLKRIAMLLKMLEWPGFAPLLPARLDNRIPQDPAQVNTRYMMISLPDVPAQERNEYKPRPVLPDPSWKRFGGITGTALERENNLKPKNESGTPSPANSDDITSVKSPSTQMPPKPTQNAPIAKANRGNMDLPQRNDRLQHVPEASPSISSRGFSGAKTRQWVTLPSKPRPDKPRVITQEGETIPCDKLPAVPPMDDQGRFRADVNYENGKPVRARWVAGF